MGIPVGTSMKKFITLPRLQRDTRVVLVQRDIENEALCLPRLWKPEKFLSSCYGLKCNGSRYMWRGLPTPLVQPGFLRTPKDEQ